MALKISQRKWWNGQKSMMCIFTYIQPGKPAQNTYIERFNRTYREEVLNMYLFKTITEVQSITDKWMHEYNHERV